jgi:hypothetical protein
MAAVQLEPSAQAPWTRTMFGRSPIEVSFLQAMAKNSCGSMLSHSSCKRDSDLARESG